MMTFIEGNINVVIIVLGVIVTFFTFWNYFAMLGHRKAIKDALYGTRKESKIDSETGRQEVTEKRVVASPEEIRQKESEFQKTCSWYNVLSQIVPIFPLLGILGTVAGLIVQLSTAEEMAGIDLALKSTFIGLIFAIGLKFVMAIFNSKCIYDTESLYSSYDKEFNTNIGLKNVTK